MIEKHLLSRLIIATSAIRGGRKKMVLCALECQSVQWKAEGLVLTTGSIESVYWKTKVSELEGSRVCTKNLKELEMNIQRQCQRTELVQRSKRKDFLLHSLFHTGTNLLTGFTHPRVGLSASVFTNTPRLSSANLLGSLNLFKLTSQLTIALTSFPWDIHPEVG